MSKKLTRLVLSVGVFLVLGLSSGFATPSVGSATYSIQLGETDGIIEISLTPVSAKETGTFGTKSLGQVAVGAGAQAGLASADLASTMEGSDGGNPGVALAQAKVTYFFGVFGPPGLVSFDIATTVGGNILSIEDARMIAVARVLVSGPGFADTFETCVFGDSAAPGFTGGCKALANTPALASFEIEANAIYTVELDASVQQIFARWAEAPQQHSLIHTFPLIRPSRWRVSTPW